MKFSSANTGVYKVHYLLNEFLIIYGTRSFIPVFKTPHHCPCPRQDECNLSFVFLRIWIFPSDFPTKTSLLCHVTLRPCPFHPPWLHRSNNICLAVQVIKLHKTETFSFACYYSISLGPKYFPRFPVLRTGMCFRLIKILNEHYITGL
jgi:hypothetical protein